MGGNGHPDAREYFPQGGDMINIGTVLTSAEPRAMLGQIPTKRTCMQGGGRICPLLT
jgi:hypothetical protein